MNRKRNAREQMIMKVRDSEGNILTERAAVRQRWSEYYEALLNVDDGRRAQLSEGVRVNDDANDELKVSVEDVRKAVKKLKKKVSRQE